MQSEYSSFHSLVLSALIVEVKVVVLVVVVVVLIAVVVLVIMVTYLSLWALLFVTSLSGWSSTQPQLCPSGHQTGQLGRPARGLQPTPGKPNPGPPSHQAVWALIFMNEYVCLGVYVYVFKLVRRALSVMDLLNVLLLQAHLKAKCIDFWQRWDRVVIFQVTRKTDKSQIKYQAKIDKSQVTSCKSQVNSQVKSEESESDHK